MARIYRIKNNKTGNYHSSYTKRSWWPSFPTQAIIGAGIKNNKDYIVEVYEPLFIGKVNTDKTECEKLPKSFDSEKEIFKNTIELSITQVLDLRKMGLANEQIAGMLSKMTYDSIINELKKLK